MRALIALLAVAGAAQQQQFDLTCEGSSQGFPINHPESTRYHVDLAAKEWCTGSGSNCIIKVIAQVDPSIIWFKNDPRNAHGGDEWIEYVDRTSGKWVREMGPWVTEGTCEPAPFTGFSALPTKF